MPAGDIFVLVLVVGSVLGLSWLSIDSHRRAKREQQLQDDVVVVQMEAAEQGRQPAGAARRRGRKQ